jgi:hypothetical protein
VRFDNGLTAWATLALAFLAAFTAWYARRAWLAQKDEIETLRQQLASQKSLNEKQLPVLEGQRRELQASLAQREREAQERHEALVRQVFIWHEVSPDPRVGQAQAAAGAVRGEVSRVWIRNTAPVPVYDVGFGWWTADGIAHWSGLDKPLMPGTDAAPAESTQSRPWEIRPGVDSRTISVAAFIRDAAGNCWRLEEGGHYQAYTAEMLPPGQWQTT